MDENRLYELLVRRCDPDTRQHAEALYKEIVDTLKTTDKDTDKDTEPTKPLCVRCETPFLEGKVCSESNFTLLCVLS